MLARGCTGLGVQGFRFNVLRSGGTGLTYWEMVGNRELDPFSSQSEAQIHFLHSVKTAASLGLEGYNQELLLTMGYIPKGSRCPYGLYTCAPKGSVDVYSAI